jgi:hypothetical protein
VAVGGAKEGPDCRPRSRSFGTRRRTGGSGGQAVHGVVGELATLGGVVAAATRSSSVMLRSVWPLLMKMVVTAWRVHLRVLADWYRAINAVTWSCQVVSIGSTCASGAGVNVVVPSVFVLVSRENIS